jgi:anti-anti-sigma factor
MDIKLTQMNHSTIISLEGRLEGTTASLVESAFQGLIDSGEKQFIFDLALISYISSAGLRAVLIAAKKTKSIQGKLAFVRLEANVKEVFDMSGFSTILSLYATEDEALQAFEA